METGTWVVYTKEDGVCLISDYEACKSRYDVEVQHVEDEGYSYGIEDDDCVYLMKLAESVTAEKSDETWTHEKSDETWTHENIEYNHVDGVQVGDDMWEYVSQKYEV